MTALFPNLDLGLRLRTSDFGLKLVNYASSHRLVVDSLVLEVVGRVPPV